jgi:hypothetical protein
MNAFYRPGHQLALFAHNTISVGEATHRLRGWFPVIQPQLGSWCDSLGLAAAVLRLTQVRHGMVEKTAKPCRISLGNSWVYTTFAIELETLGESQAELVQ